MKKNIQLLLVALLAPVLLIPFSADAKVYHERNNDVEESDQDISEKEGDNKIVNPWGQAKSVKALIRGWKKGKILSVNPTKPMPRPVPAPAPMPRPVPAPAPMPGPVPAPAPMPGPVPAPAPMPGPVAR